MSHTSQLTKNGSRIGLLGGSFNPPHLGHLEISLAALKALSLDQVWWLVSPGNPQKEASDYADYDKRVETCQALSQHPKIHVSTFEREYALHWSFETIAKLREVWPKLNFVWLMGADNLASFHTWGHWEDIFAQIPIAVFNRPGFDAPALASPAALKFWGARRTGFEIRRLAVQTPPAWGYIRETANPESSTRLRKIDPDWAKPEKNG